MHPSADSRDYLHHHLVALRDSYTLSALTSLDDPVRVNSLTDDYLKDASVLMSAAYGRSCADQVRATAPRRGRTRAAGVAAWLARSWRDCVAAAVDAMRRNAEEWHHQTLAMGGR